MARNDQPEPALMDASSASPVVDEAVKRAIAEQVAGEFERKARQLKERLKYVVVGFTLFLMAMPLGGDDIVRSLHEKAFPAEAPGENRNVPLISFGSGIELRVGDPTADTRFMSFYAEANQRVHLYLTITARLMDPADAPPQVVVSVDGKPVGNPITSWVGGFKDISATIAPQSVDLGREQNVHQLGFALADFGQKGSGEVVISAIILVF